MKLTIEELDQQYKDSYWKEKYINFLEIELQNPDLRQRALERSSLEKVNSLYHNRIFKYNATINDLVRNIRRKKSSLQTPKGGPAEILPRDPLLGTGDLDGSGESTGMAFLDFITSGQASASGTMHGTAYMEHIGAGTLRASGSMAGGYSVVYLNTSGSLTGQGDINGAGFIVFNSSGSFAASGTMQGSAVKYDAFLTSGSFVGSGTMSNALAYLEILTSGSFAGSGTLLGNNTYLDFLTSGSAVGSGTTTASGTLEILSVFPVIAGDILTEKFNATSHDVTMPDFIVSGDLLMIFYALSTDNNGNPDTEDPITGWEHIMSWQEDVSFNQELHIYARHADGTETGSTVTVVDAAFSSYGQSKVIRIQSGSWESGSLSSVIAFDSGSNTNAEPDTPVLSASWGSYKNLWFSWFAADNGTTGSITPPTNYTLDSVQEEPDLPVYLGNAYREYEGNNENPAVWSAFSSNPGKNFNVTTAVKGGDTALEGEALIDYLNPEFHLDAQDSSTLWQESTKTTNVSANDDPVEAWDDQQGNHDFSNGTSTLVYKTGSLNGYPCVAPGANGSADVLLSDTFNHGTDSTLFMVYENPGGSSTDYAAYQGAGGAIRVFYAPDAATGTGPGLYDGTSHRAFGTTELTGSVVAGVRLDNSTDAILFTGSFEEFGTTTFSSFNQTEEHRIFGSTPHASIGEYMFFDRILSDSEMSGVMAHLRNKWEL